MAKAGNGVEMGDGELTRTLLRHDHAIGGLDRRVESVETKLGSIDGKIDGIGAAISEMKGSKGPGLSEAMRMVYTGGGIVVMTAGAVGFLVHAYNAPDMMKLRENVAQVEASVTRREAAERAELADLRRRRDAEATELRTAVEELKGKLGWAVRVETARGR
jgi:hypothetical protein